MEEEKELGGGFEVNIKFNTLSDLIIGGYRKRLTKYEIVV